MKGVRKHPVRVTVRFFWMAGELSLAMVDFVINVIFAPKVPLPRARALWLQQTSRRLLRVLGVEIKTRGPIPLKGLLVSNHLSYVDIMVISSITPVVFISKSEVKRWPVFGWFAVLGGSLFVQRNKRSDVARLNQELAQVLDNGALVVLFPEGTSSNGQQILPFKSSLLEPVASLEHPVSAACISYSLDDGDPGIDVCYWGDMTLAPHLLNLFSKPRIGARVAFSQLEPSSSSRKELARDLHTHMVQLKGNRSSPVVA